MSVKLSELKVPEHCPYFVKNARGKDCFAVRFTYEESSPDLDKGLVPIDRYHMTNWQWQYCCAVAALCWRESARIKYELMNAMEEYSSEYYSMRDAMRDSSLQADLWQRAAFEGVEA